MSRSKGDMVSPLHKILLVVVWNLAFCTAGPVGSLPNVTSTDVGLKEGSCSLGHMVYMSGEDVPGSSPCERCTCAGGDVQCAKQRCEARPGCKALHRPDHCCPTYQCDCEQEGRVYANGEKLVYPNDPCRVCYCQGGEVVCRRIACFVRNDCRPRLVPGRCCPEYDNCPLRGVTSLPGISPPISSILSAEEISVDAVPTPPKEPIKQEITIKEITPVSEIPIKTDVKIKEIIPSSDDDIEYSSSKSPLIPREVTSERVPTDVDSNTSSDPPDVKASTSLDPSASDLSTLSINNPTDSKTSSDLVTKDHTDSEVYSSKIPIIVPLMGSPLLPDTLPTPLTTKAPIIEDEDAPIENPAFPPIPDDLSVMGNHEDEQNIDNEQPNDHEVVNIPNVLITTAAPVFKESSSTYRSSEASSGSTQSSVETTSDASTIKDIFNSTQSAVSRENTMLDLRSEIPKEILDAPSLISNETTGELLDVTEASVKETSEERDNFSRGSTESEYTKNIQTEAVDESNELISSTEIDTMVTDNIEETTEISNQPNVKDDILSSTSKLGEITAQTEFSSIPIETSDQNPHEIIDKNYSEKVFVSTTDSPSFASLTTKHTPDSEVITLLAEVPSAKDDRSYEYVETTEFIVTPYYSEESATEAVELIKISPNGEESSAIILQPKGGKNNNVLTDLINLVGDVASIPDHTEKSDSDYQTSGPVSLLNSNSEELIPVNAGYKSKNNNWNLNSITEMPAKNKNSAAVNKQKVVEIEDDDSDNITDSPPPNDKVEPTTRRPIIDNVSDNTPANKTDKSNKKDIEIITQSYVPTINKRPTKVIMKEENVTSASAESVTSASTAANVSSENSTLFIDTTIAPNVEEFSTDTERSVEQSTEHTSTVPQ